MEEKEKKQKIQAMADVIQNLLQQVDMFTQILSKEDFDILEEARDTLKDKINYKDSASIVFFALGVNADTTEDKMKLKTIDLIIDLMKVRIEYKEETLKLQEENKNKQNAIELFRQMGMI